MSHTLLRGPVDDWDAEGYEDETTQNLAALSLHTTGSDQDKEEEEGAAPASKDEGHEEEIDELAALDRLERELKANEFQLAASDEDDTL